MSDDRPTCVDPNAEVVHCHFCGYTMHPENASEVDLSGDEEYYPKMVPACPGGCR